MTKTARLKGLVLNLGIALLACPAAWSSEAPASERAVLPGRRVIAAAAAGNETIESAPEGARLPRARQAYAQRDFVAAALLFSEVERGPEPEGEKLQAEIFLAHSLLELDLFDSALRQYDFVLRAGPHHPFYDSALAGVVAVNVRTGEDTLTSAILDREYGDGFARLPPELLDAINALVGTAVFRAGRHEEARGFLASVSPESPFAPRARYVLGLIHALTGAPEKALALFEALSRPAPMEPSPVLPGSDKGRASAPLSGPAAVLPPRGLRALADLAAARTLYGMGRFTEAVRRYEAIPRFSPHWEEALFENGWARLQNEDDGGALGTLQALHAPQFAGSFQPESWILKATIFFSHCLHDEARAALDAYERLYGPQREALRALLTQERSAEGWLALMDGEGLLPNPIRREISKNERFKRHVGRLSRVEEEERALRGQAAWRASPLQKRLLESVKESRAIAQKVAAAFIEHRVRDAFERLIGFDAQKEILRFEIARQETEQLEARFDARGELRAQQLHRPALKSEQQEYWPFEGEFWLDEIGHYQFTLKSGCRPLDRDAQTSN